VEGLKVLHQEALSDPKGKGKLLCDASKFESLETELATNPFTVYLSPTPSPADEVLKRHSLYLRHPLIKDSQLVSYDNGEVTFRTHPDTTVTLSAEAFVRRFFNHVKAPGFHRIRHTGLYSSYDIANRLPIAKQLLPEHRASETSSKKSGGSGNKCLWEAENWQDILGIRTGQDPRVCPKCGQKTMAYVGEVNPGYIPREGVPGVEDSS